MDERMDGRTDRRTKGQTYERTNSQTGLPGLPWEMSPQVRCKLLSKMNIPSEYKQILYGHLTGYKIGWKKTI